jgi:hypothetical protein
MDEGKNVGQVDAGEEGGGDAGGTPVETEAFADDVLFFSPVCQSEKEG